MTVTVTIHETDRPDTSITVSESALALIDRWNPNAPGGADEMKVLAAAFVTLCEAQQARGVAGAGRRAAVAITQVEGAAMWGVKAAFAK